jgi:hypothetical protein
MAAAKLDFLGSATLAENQTELMLPDAAAAFIRGQPDMRLRQLMQDFLLNQRFRRDVFVRGHAHLSPPQVQRNNDNQIVLAIKSLAKLDPKVKVPRGVANMDPKLLAALDAVLKNGTATVLELGRKASTIGRPGDLSRVVGMLLAANALMPAAGIFRAAKGFQPEGQLRIPAEVNRRLLTRAATPEDAAGKSRALVSSALGGILPIGLLNAILLQSLTEAGGLDRAITKTLQVMARLGINLRKDEKTLTEPTAKHAHLTELAQAFVEQDLPALMAAGIVEAV